MRPTLMSRRRAIFATVVSLFAGVCVMAALVGATANAALLQRDDNGRLKVDKSEITDAMRTAYLTDIEQRFVPLEAEETEAIALFYGLNVDQYIIFGPQTVGLERRVPGNQGAPHNGDLLVDSNPHGRLVEVSASDMRRGQPFTYTFAGAPIKYFNVANNPGAGDSLVHPFWGIIHFGTGPSPNNNDADPDRNVQDQFVRASRAGMVAVLNRTCQRPKLNKLVEKAILELARGMNSPTPRLFAVLQTDASFVAVRPPAVPPPALPPASAPPPPPTKPAAKCNESSDTLTTKKSTIRAKKRKVSIKVRAFNEGVYKVTIRKKTRPRKTRSAKRKVQIGINRLRLPTFPQKGTYNTTLRSTRNPAAPPLKLTVKIRP